MRMAPFNIPNHVPREMAPSGMPQPPLFTIDKKQFPSLPESSRQPGRTQFERLYASAARFRQTRSNSSRRPFEWSNVKLECACHTEANPGPRRWGRTDWGRMEVSETLRPSQPCRQRVWVDATYRKWPEAGYGMISGGAWLPSSCLSFFKI